MITERQRERFKSRYHVVDGCHVWMGKRSDRGYGLLLIGSRTDSSRRWAKAHRVSYEISVGPVPDGLELDHICRNRACVNPDHLRAITHRENLLCGDTIIARQMRNAVTHG